MPASENQSGLIRLAGAPCTIHGGRPASEKNRYRTRRPANLFLSRRGGVLGSRSWWRRALSKLDYRSCLTRAAEIDAALNGQATQRCQCSIQVWSAGRRQFLRSMWMAARGHSRISENRRAAWPGSRGVTFFVAGTQDYSRELSM